MSALARLSAAFTACGASTAVGALAWWRERRQPRPRPATFHDGPLNLPATPAVFVHEFRPCRACARIRLVTIHADGSHTCTDCHSTTLAGAL